MTQEIYGIWDSDNGAWIKTWSYLANQWKFFRDDVYEELEAEKEASSR